MMKTPDSRDCYSLIIGGTTRSATSSLFFYLKHHPDICASNMKETRFFLDKSYPLLSKYRFEDGIEKYHEFYKHCKGQRIRMEATPDYLYSKGTPHKILSSLVNSRFIFILREPIARLISWYKFAKQNNMLNKHTTFDDYVRTQRHIGNDIGIDQHMLSLKHGQYSRYLKPYLDLFGRERVIVILFDDLLASPLQTINAICHFMRINSAYFDNFNFKVFNQSLNIKNARLHQGYQNLRYNLSNFTHNKPPINTIIKILKDLFEPLYLRLNSRPTASVTMSPFTKEFLMDYYYHEVVNLESMLNIKIPWIRSNNSLYSIIKRGASQ